MQQKTSTLLVGLLVVAAFLVGSMWTKIQYLEGRNGNTPAPAGNAQNNPVTPGQASTAPAESPLSVVNIKAYAKELGLDTNKFNTCLDKKTYDKTVTDDTSYGQSIGVNGTPSFFINGKFVSGAQPVEVFKEIIDKEIAGTGSTDAASYSTNLQNLAKQQGFTPAPVEVKINPTDPVRGAKNAKVTIVEFSDFECPFCARAFPTVQQLEQTYKDQLRLVFKQYPLPFHPNANGAANASLCANEQGKFWEMHDKLFLVNK